MTHGGHGYGAFLGDENDLALACAMAFPAPFLAFQYLQGTKRWLAGGATLVLLLGIVASFSRGGFLGLAAAFGYCIIASERRVRNLAVCGVLSAVFLLSIPVAYRQEMGTIRETSSGTAEERLFLWFTATRMWADHPIFGVGPRNSAYLLSKYQPPPTEGGLFSGSEYQGRSWGMKALHSTYFELLSERGLVGVALFAAMAFEHFRGLRRLRRRFPRKRIPPALARDATLYALALEAGLVGYLVAGSFLSMLTYPFFWFFTALAVAHERGVRRDLLAVIHRNRNRTPKGKRTPIATIAPQAL